MTGATFASETGHQQDLLGQTVVVIGGSSGIGLETARLARARGADVVLTGQLEGQPLLLLHHTGARSGIEGVTPLLYWRVTNTNVAVLASNYGAQRQTRWTSTRCGG